MISVSAKQLPKGISQGSLVTVSQWSYPGHTAQLTNTPRWSGGVQYVTRPGQCPRAGATGPLGPILRAQYCVLFAGPYCLYLPPAFTQYILHLEEQIFGAE